MHIKEIGDIEVDDNFVTDGWSRSQNTRITGIVLHFTVSNSAAASIRNAAVSGIGAQYYVDRDGNVAQSAQDYNAIGHAGYGGPISNIRTNGNDFTIGIEISNWGVAVANGDDYTNYNSSQNMASEDVVNVRDTYPNVWSIWSDTDHNMAWGNSGVNNLTHETWQTYTANQMGALHQLLDYLGDRYGIPVTYFSYNNPHEYSDLTTAERNIYSWYYYPSDSTERVTYNTAVDNFPGIFGHHNITGKYDPGPAFDITH